MLLKELKLHTKNFFILHKVELQLGTGINTSTKFIKGFIKAIQIITNLPFKESKNKFEAISSHEPIIFFSSSINSLL